MTNDGLARALDRIEGGDPRAMAWLRRIASGQFASSFGVQPRRVITVAGPDLLAAMAWWDAAGRKERAAAESWWLSLDRT